ncbi:hypothetical protein FJZ31_08185 [Candidatus Poribacteria bacterium]|nr:hypothetical protein [Candidatus Poribacteria bacterium]
MFIDKRLNTEKITPELINYIVEKIVREIQPEKIILFGSYARGDLPFESIGEDDAIEAIEAVDKIEEFVLKKIDLRFENAKNSLEDKKRK